MFNPGFKRILIINPFGIGDCLFTTPVIHTLKDTYKDVKIGYLCNGRARAVLENNPFIDSLFIYERDEFEALREKRPFVWIKKLHALLKAIRAESFDLALDFSLNTQYGFLCRLCGIKKRCGYDFKRRARFLTDKIPLESFSGKHIVEYYNGLLVYLGIAPKFNHLELYLRQIDEDWARDTFAREGINRDALPVVIIPGGGASWGRDAYLKRWGAVNFAQLADKIIEKYKVPVIIMGNSQEAQVCRQVKSGMLHAALDYCGKTTTAEFAALLNCAQLVIANDGGPLHMAVALNKKTISFFGPVDPVVYGPYPEDTARHIVLRRDLECSPCYRNFRMADCVRGRECLEKIDIDQAMEAVDKLLIPPP